MGTPDKDQVTRKVHSLIKPLFRIGLLYAQHEVREISDRHRAYGWDQMKIRALDEALAAWGEDLKAMGTDYSSHVSDLRNLVLPILDVEHYWASRWMNALLRRLKEKGLLDPWPEPT